MNIPSECRALLIALGLTLWCIPATAQEILEPCTDPSASVKDINGDGLLSSEEWTGTPRDFSDLDRNRDGSISTEERLAYMMLEWEEHRSRTIEVLAIEGIQGSSDVTNAKAALEARLNTLMSKRASNREWRYYWKGEALCARAVAKIYGEVKSGRAPTALTDQERELKGKAATLRVEMKRIQKRLSEADIALRNARIDVEQRLEVEKAALTPLVERAKQLRASSEEATATFARLDQELNKLPDDALPEEKQRLTQEAAQAKIRMDQLATELQTAEQAAAAAQKKVDFVEAKLDGRPTQEPGPVDPDMMASIAKLTDLPTQHDALKAEIAQHEADLNNALQDIAELEQERAAREDLTRDITRRLGVLERWALLGDDKQENQDVYYKAIDADLEAVQERLSDFKEHDTEHIGRSRRACEGVRAQREESSLEHYYNCVEHIEKELSELREMLDANHASLELARVQLSSLDQLLVAQENDTRLVDREINIPEDELRSLRALGRIESGELTTWESIWATYYQRAKRKHAKLEDAVITSKISQRSIVSNIEYYETEIANIEEKIQAAEAYLVERTRAGVWFRAALRTVWEFVKTAWPVPIYLLVAWILLWLAKRFTHKIIDNIKDDATNQDEAQRVETLGTVARGAFKLIVFIATGLMVFDGFGVDVGPILGGAAIFGLAISFGSQNLVKDVVTGFFILLENQYAVGDVVEIGGKSGTVENITLRRTVLRDMQGVVHNIANGSIGTVSNMSQGWARVLVHIGVGYGSDLEQVQRVVDDVGDGLFNDPEWDGRLSEPPRYIGLISFDDSSLKVRIMFKTPIFENWGAEREFNRRIKLAFDREGIEIPFPQRDIHIIRGADLTSEEEEALAT